MSTFHGDRRGDRHGYAFGPGAVPQLAAPSVLPRRRFLGASLAGAALATLGRRVWAQTQVLYEKASRYNHIVVTEDGGGLRTLRFGKNGPRQSVVKVGDPDHLELAYAQAMQVALALVQEPARILVVGLGGGTLPMFLRRHCPQAAIDAVEIDPDVVEVARTFFGFQEDARLRAHVADGRAFIEQCARPYDLMVLDAFGADSIPYALATREFLEAVRRVLTPRGVAAGNLWGPESNALYDSMVRTYQNVFASLYILNVPGTGNQILFAFPRRQNVRRKVLAREAQALARRERFRFDLGELVRSHFRPSRTVPPSGRVLTDKIEGEAQGAEAEDQAGSRH
ncbi:MAG: fused MFS/spermidine synthase [Verrucomicrobia bacterium]|nr:fused MFS/spermidine synthase [Verrucomicrobiota bacterium]